MVARLHAVAGVQSHALDVTSSPSCIQSLSRRAGRRDSSVLGFFPLKNSWRCLSSLILYTLLSNEWQHVDTPSTCMFMATWRRPRICQQHNSSLLVSAVRSEATRPPKPVPSPRPGRQIDTAPKSIYQKENLHPQPKSRTDTTPDSI